MATHTFRSDPAEGLDLSDPALTSDFDAAVSYLVKQCPVAHGPEGYWLISRYEDVKRLARNPTEFYSGDGIRTYREEGQPALIPVELDAPDHTKWRQALQPFFTQQAVGRYRDGITAAAHELIDAFALDGRADIAETFANPFPGVAFFREVLGAPDDDMSMLISVMSDANFGPLEGRPLAWQTIAGYVDAQLRARQSGPARDDLLQHVLDLELDGEPIDWNDKINAVSLLISGGLDTTAHVLGGAIWHLANNPDWAEQLRSDRALLRDAIEEYLRLHASAFAIGRTTRSPQTVGQREIPAGQRVMLGYALACRDDQVFDDPHTFDPLRSNIGKHLAFGMGPHRCMGSHLARLELEIGLNAILDRFSDLRPDPSGTPTFAVGMMRSAVSLPILFEASASRPDEDA